MKSIRLLIEHDYDSDEQALFSLIHYLHETTAFPSAYKDITKRDGFITFNSGNKTIKLSKCRNPYIQ